MKLQALGAGDVAHDRTRSSVERDRQRLLAGSTPPDRCLATVRFLNIAGCVVAPARGNRQFVAQIPATRKLSPIDDVKNALRAALRWEP